MIDLKRLWSFVVSGLHAIFVFIVYFSTKAPLPLGVVLIVMSVLVNFYQKRRNFYGSLDVAADWSPTYGGIVSARVEETFLNTLRKLTLFFGVMTLFQHFLPVLFEDIFGFLVGVTSSPMPAAPQ